MKRVTDFSLTTLVIPVDKWKLLPVELRKQLSHHIDHGNDSQFVFEVNSVVAAEFEQATKALVNPDRPQFPIYYDAQGNEHAEY